MSRDFMAVRADGNLGRPRSLAYSINSKTLPRNQIYVGTFEKAKTRNNMPTKRPTKNRPLHIKNQTVTFLLRWTRSMQTSAIGRAMIIVVPKMIQKPQLSLIESRIATTQSTTGIIRLPASSTHTATAQTSPSTAGLLRLLGGEASRSTFDSPRGIGGWSGPRG